MPAPLSPETLAYGLQTASEPQLSPDGARVLYTRTRASRRSRRLERSVWEWSPDSGRHRRVGVADDSAGARWSPDGARFAFVARRRASYLLFVRALDGTPARAITQHAQPINGLAWSPDGRTIAYTTAYDVENPDERPWAGPAPRPRVTRRLDYKRDGRGFLGDVREQLFVVSVADGSRRRLSELPGDLLAPQWSPDGRWIAAEASDWQRYGSRLVLVNRESGATRPVSPAEGVVYAWAWAPDGERLLYAGAAEISPRTGQYAQPDFYLYTLGSGETRRLTDGFAACFPGHTDTCSADLVWLDGQHILFHAVEAGASALFTLDTADGTLTRLRRWQALHSGMSVDATCRRIAFPTGGPDRYGEILIVDRLTGVEGPCTKLNARLLREHPPAAWEPISVRREPWSLDAWLLLPPSFSPERRYPVVLMVHGGPQSYFGYMFDLLQQCLATNGFLVLICNPRGSSSYGQAFAQAVVCDYGGEDYADLIAALDQIGERPYVDVERAGIVGFSYGGYMTAWAIGQSTRFKAAVSGAAFVDNVSLYGTADDGSAWGRLDMGGALEQRLAHYQERSALTWAHRARTPTLILHGEEDQRCPIGQGEQLYTALSEAGCPVEFVRYPGADHWWFEGAGAWPQHREDVLRRVLDWFRDHLGPWDTPRP